MRRECSHPTISRIERGHISAVTVDRLRTAAAALDARIMLEVRWRGSDLARLLDERRAAMQHMLAARFAGMPGWQFVIELKTELADLQDLLATMDRKRRLAPEIARERGWRARDVGTWVVIEEGRENRRRVGQHAAVLRHAFPATSVGMRRWLARPTGTIAGLSFLTIVRPGNASRRLTPRRRVRPSSIPGAGHLVRGRDPEPGGADDGRASGGGTGRLRFPT